MSYEDEEMKDFELFGLHFRATNAEQRALWVKLCVTEASNEWGIAKNQMKMYEMTFGRQHSTYTSFYNDLCARMENADKAMTLLCAKLIDEMIAARS